MVLEYLCTRQLAGRHAGCRLAVGRTPANQTAIRHDYGRRRNAVGVQLTNSCTVSAELASWGEHIDLLNWLLKDELKRVRLIVVLVITCDCIHRPMEYVGLISLLGCSRQSRWSSYVGSKPFR